MFDVMELDVVNARPVGERPQAEAGAFTCDAERMRLYRQNALL